MSTSNFGERLKQLRREKNLTQEQLAEVFGVARNSIFSYETGRRIPDIEVLKSYAEYFGVTSDYLLGLSDNRTNETAAIGGKLGLWDDAIHHLEDFVTCEAALSARLEDVEDEHDTKIINEIINSKVFGESFAEVYNNISNIQMSINLLIIRPDVLITLGRYLFHNDLFLPEPPSAYGYETGEEFYDEKEVRQYDELLEMIEAVNMVRLQKKLAELREFCIDDETTSTKLRAIDKKTNKYFHDFFFGKRKKQHSTKEENNAEEDQREE